MNTLAELQAKRTALLAELDRHMLREVDLHRQINEVELSIASIAHAEDTRYLLATIEQRNRADYEAAQAAAAANAAAAAAHRLRSDGETEAARAQRLRMEQIRIDNENARTEREEANRRARLAALR